jgi:oxidase EvaA
MNIYDYLFDSWIKKDNTINSISDIRKWIDKIKQNTNVVVTKIKLSECKSWHLDNSNGYIKNYNSSFFTIVGLEQKKNNFIHHQPILLQEEIGYLGIISKIIDNTLYFLMQAKIEPGNVNKVQISPTIQSTKSNFTQKHGGSKPAYIDYFINSERYLVIIDQIQSEQSSRFFKKRNRNIIIMIEDDIDLLDSHRWMTLGQIKELLRIDNLVNMDTRSVISAIPFHKANFNSDKTRDKALYYSLFNDNLFDKVGLYNRINNYKMFDESTTSHIPLTQLNHWDISEYEIFSNKYNEFKIIFCDIEIEGREVKRWNQPLIEACGEHLLGLFTMVENEIRYFLIKLISEIGTFDKLELGPTLQIHLNSIEKNQDSISTLFLYKIKNKSDILYDVNLSEEGGRFYNEVNRNIIIEIKKDETPDLPTDYFWIDYKTLLNFMEFNNIVNIQLRNLISLLEV